ncbi:MAG: tyrosine-type recombinase/integrase [Bacillota bacterium]
MSRVPKRGVSRKRVKNKASVKNRDSKSLDEVFERFMDVKNLQGLAEQTLTDYVLHFSLFKKYINRDLLATDLTIDMIRKYMNHLLNELELAPHTVNIRTRTLKAFFRFCFKEEYIQRPLHEQMKLVKVPKDAIQSFTPQEIRTLISVVDETTVTGYRDRTMMYFMLDTLVRVKELLAIRRENVDLKNGIITLKAVDTKTKKMRQVPISDIMIKMLKVYIRKTEQFDPEYLFVTMHGEKISDNTVRKFLQDYGRKANVTGKRVSPHTFRHTGALFYILNGGDPFSLQKILGHSDMTMVRRYVQMTNLDMKTQHKNFSPLKRLEKTRY